MATSLRTGPALQGGGSHTADLVFRERASGERAFRRVPARTEFDVGPRYVRVRPGRRWSPGDGDRLLAALAWAERWRAPVEVVGDGLPLGGVLAAAVAERPWLRVRVRSNGDRPHGPVDTTSWEPVTAPRWRPPVPGPVVITGGLGGIGLRSAREFAVLGHPVVLVDRTDERGLPPERAEALAAVRATAPTTVVRADLDGIDAHAVLRTLSAPAVHLVHAAGELGLRRWDRWSGTMLDRAARRRGEQLGRWVRAAARGPLASVLVPGSTESRAAHRGFGAYALSHACSRAAVRELAEAFPRVTFTVAEWTLWSEVGMAAGVAGPGLRAAGFAVVPPAWGARTLVRLLGRPGTEGEAGVYALGGPRLSRSSGAVAVVGGVGGAANLDPADPGSTLNRVLRGCLPGIGHARVEAPTGHGGPRTVRALVGPDGVRLWSSDPQDWRPDGGYEALVPF
ncbi:hypothetical protein [Nocardiopsis lambiniae]|uniref:Ketoreductase domain-containing protein n=1 Tax=Nocardiopsis lambiniae TaxID=3075539 RepID=A0ABU2MA34_9ACTN|nr:hypothetical protein [Nocardiopsis sp. DSM 44743]MDT0329469.1 hypothetical protein [Nocardiopsis sp. DSM 44743]